MNVPASILLQALIFWAAALPPTVASDLPGRVLFAGLAVPGATVTATRHLDAGRADGTGTVATAADDDGAFRFIDLDDGLWTLRVEMRGFVTMSREVTVPFAEPSLIFTLTMQSYDEIVGVTPSDAAPSRPPLAPVAGPPPLDSPEVINGSVINGAASAFAQPRAFGNNRPRQGARYTGGVSALVGNSAWNARPYSFSGSPEPTTSGSDVHLGFALLGPLKIPWLVKDGPQTFINVQHGIVHNTSTQSAVTPTRAERLGDFSAASFEIRDPETGLAFPRNRIPADRISPQAVALLEYYPLPNVATASGANYQTPILSTATQDSLQLGINQNLTNRITLGATVTFQRTVTDAVNLFAFADASRQSALSAAITMTRRFSTRVSMRLRYQLTQFGTSVMPFFADRTNVSGDAGIVGNNQDPANWGPPALLFPDIADLRDAQYVRSSSRAHAGGVEVSLRGGRHNLTLGGDVRRTGFDLSSQPDPRGTLSFTGAATGSALADFLVGVPATSSIAFGDSDTRLRAPAYDAYIADDFRVGAGLTLNLGVRWEYEAPFTEASGGLVNLDVAPGFAAISPVLATSPVGALTGTSLPTSLVRPDQQGVQPRLAASWRPLPGSSLVVRGSYGIYRNLGVYQPIALLLSQQPPLATTFSVQNGPLTPLTLARPFPWPLASASNTFAVDPNFRSGYVHTWQASAQRDVPGSLTVIVVYDGAKGSHLMQAFLPNTYPAGAPIPCVRCPSGFVYITSNGGSLRNAGQFTLRRRLHHGFTASVQYTVSKATDDAATFSNKAIAPASLAIAQDWLDLAAERGPSSFDQPHLVSAQFQYTTGVGVTGGTLVDGLRGSLLKDWTIAGQLSAGSGLPFTPVSFTAVAGTGVVGVRPTLTGVPAVALASDSYANPAAFEAPSPGTWGDAGRNSIRGPSQFSFDMSVSRVFRLRGRLNLEWRAAATNVLNRVTFATIGTVITSSQFGLPTLANPMRRVQMSVRLRF